MVVKICVCLVGMVVFLLIKDVITVGGEDLCLLGWNGCVPLDQGCHHSTCSFYTKGERSNIKKEKITNSFRLISCKNCCLHCSAISYSFVRVDRFVQFFSIKEV